MPFWLWFVLLAAVLLRMFSSKKTSEVEESTSKTNDFTKSLAENFVKGMFENNSNRSVHVRSLS